jgi:hypothetical protein
MKILFTIFLILISVSMKAQKEDVDSILGDVKFDTIIVAKGTKDDLYKKAKIWLGEEFNSAKDVIQTEDKEDGYILGKGNFKYTYILYYTKKKEIKSFTNPETNRAKFTIKLFIKEDKVKLVISDIYKVSQVSGFEESEIKFSNFEYEIVKRGITSNDIKEKASALSMQSEIKSIENNINQIITSLSNSLKRKSESDF